jgi:hypothetical protein
MVRASTVATPDHPRIAETADEYVKFTVPENASEGQRIDVRTAFIAGSWTVLRMLAELSEPHISDEYGVIVLGQLHKEAKMLMEEIKRDAKRRAER